MRLIVFIFIFIFFQFSFSQEYSPQRYHNPENKIDLSSDGWVSVNDILMEEGHAYEYDGGKKKVFNG